MFQKASASMMCREAAYAIEWCFSEIGFGIEAERVPMQGLYFRHKIRVGVVLLHMA